MTVMKAFRCDYFRVRGMYGTRVSFADVGSLELLNVGLGDIYVGNRLNGSDTRAMLRGYFHGGLFFVERDATEIIFIQRRGETSQRQHQYIYIGLNCTDATTAIFNALDAGLRRALGFTPITEN